MKPTQTEILEATREEQEMTITAFAQELGTSRQSYHSWIAKTEIDIETLQVLAISHRGGWVGQMAVKLLNSRDKRLVPCVCQTRIGDKGYCPKHSQKNIGGGS